MQWQGTEAVRSGRFLSFRSIPLQHGADDARARACGVALREPVIRHAFWELLLDEHDRTASRKNAIDPFDQVFGGSDLELRRERPRGATSEVQELSIRLETMRTEQLSDRRPTLTKAPLDRRG